MATALTSPAINPPAPLVKHPDWEARLAAFVCRRAHTPFTWGVQDCALFTCDALAVVSEDGVDLAAGLRGYAGALGAQRKMVEFLREHGNGAAVTGRSLLELVAERVAAAHGLMEVERGSVMAGDAALVAAVAEDRVAGGRAHVALAVVDGEGQVVSAGTHGLVRGERGSIVRAWRVRCA